MSSGQSPLAASVHLELAQTRQTIPEIIDRYLRHVEFTGAISPSALAGRRSDLTRFARHVGHVPAAECPAYLLSDWIESQRWAPSTRRTKAAAVNACFAWAAKQGRIPSNPFAGVSYGESERRPAMPDDILDQIAAAASAELKSALRFLRLVGCRREELCQASWGDVDWERGTVRIEAHKGRRRTMRVKLLVLPASALSLLKDLLAARTDLFGPPGPDSPIFLTPRGRRWTGDNLGDHLLRLIKRRGIATPARLHGLRHQFATKAVAAGAPLKLVAEALGDTVATIERYYVDLSGETEAIRRAAEAAQPK